MGDLQGGLERNKNMDDYYDDDGDSSLCSSK